MDFLIVDDDPTFREGATLLVEEEGHYAEAVGSGEAALTRLREDRFEAVLLDLHLGAENGLDVLSDILRAHPGMPVVLCTAEGTVAPAVEAMRRGAVDYLEKPFRRDHLLTVVARLQRIGQLDQRIRRLEQEVSESRSGSPEPLFDFSTPAMREVMDVLSRAAPTPASILILGESGTGKGVVAREVHHQSDLRDRAFVTVSCPSLSRELLESDLFGHTKGAFTGAVKDHWGKVRAAEGGTLFLDEIGDLPVEIQPKLLRLLQEREYERLGENVTRQARVRVIAATNRDLKQRVAEGHFREDLFFRLNVISVTMPPLRARQEDIVRFAGHYLRHFAAQCGRRFEGFSDDARAELMRYPWPGNLRELRNAIERAAILARGQTVHLADLPLELRAPVEPGAEAGPVDTDEILSLDRLEERAIRRALKRASSLAQAAQWLGIDQATLYRKRKKLGLSGSDL
ncbi:MAG: sigma-54-dependent Fis family transcriptional regulator [Verrucomicrobiae bacterium]|nr:sigma-54-dependent Fis family transcriptional regulator [Verrucomicrobiae bacterium]